ncbi:MAG: hypothetical protein RMK52_07050 [Chitinophagales bacterium]|nr:hypothetical protein [Chitinophagales bacterium]MDW8393987.1 hypothetical protein [Chitinophagales bacterium]
MKLPSRPDCIALLLPLLPFALAAQTNIPYSRYGMGLLMDPTGASLRGWGSPAAAFQNAYASTFLNPASYAHLQVTTLEANLYQNVMTISTSADSSGSFADGGLYSLSLTFPIVRGRLGLSTGLMPFSRVSYSLVQRNDSLTGIGVSYNQFKGSGGSNLFYIGTGARWGNFSAGINAAYLFGRLSYSSLLVFDDTLNAYNTFRSEDVVVGDFLFHGGIQYRFDLGADNRRLFLGLSGNLATDVRARRNLLYSRFTFGFGGVQVVEDTILNVTDETGNLHLPASFQAAAIYAVPGKLMTALCYQAGRWSDYRAFGLPDFTINNWKATAGVQFIPNSENVQSFWSQVAYRASFSLGTSYWQINGQKLSEQILTLGAGLPVRRLLSETAIALEYHRLGSVNRNTVAIRQYRLTVGFLLSDRWFLKRRLE